MKKPIILTILDGFGLKKEEHGNAIKQAKTPNFDYLNDFVLGEGRFSNITEETFQTLLKQKQDEYEFYKKLTTILL